jgi:hypothetical protein
MTGDCANELIAEFDTASRLEPTLQNLFGTTRFDYLKVKSLPTNNGS